MSTIAYIQINAHYRATVQTAKQLDDYLTNNPDQIGQGFGTTEWVSHPKGELRKLEAVIAKFQPSER